MLVSGTPRWQKVVTLIVLGTLLVLNLVIISVGRNNTSVLKKQDISIERQDCAREINADQVRIRDGVTLAKARMDEAWLLSQIRVFQHPEETTAVIPELQTLAGNLDAALKAVDDLPDPAKLVEARCPH